MGLKDKGFKHESVNHGVGEYIRGKAHTNGIESFWSMLKRGYVGVYHSMSEKHLQRYVDAAVATHNGRQESTMKNMSGVVQGMLGKRLSYKELTKELPPESEWGDLTLLTLLSFDNPRYATKHSIYYFCHFWVSPFDGLLESK